MSKSFEVVVASDYLTVLSASKRKKLGLRGNHVNCFLIAQLAKDVSVQTNVTGHDILTDACSKLRTAYSILGGVRSIAVEYMANINPLLRELRIYPNSKKW
ncbi:MAG: hypothetical protein ACE3JK_16720 [Sporolactobacillus sp.]